MRHTRWSNAVAEIELVEEASRAAWDAVDGYAAHVPWEFSQWLGGRMRRRMRAVADAGLLADPAALNLALWLHAEEKWHRSRLDDEALRWTETAGQHAEEVERLQARVNQLEEQVAAGHRVQLAVAGQWLGHAADKLGDGPGSEYLQRLAEWLANGVEGDEPELHAALQGDQSTEPTDGAS